MRMFTEKYSHSFTAGKIDQSVNKLDDLKFRVKKHFAEMNVSNTKNDEKIESRINTLNTKLDSLINNFNSCKNSVQREK